MLGSDIDGFIGSLRFERSMAENTCAAYARDLRLFSKYLKKRGISAASDVTREDIAGFLGEERASGRKSSTRARRTAAIRMFFGQVGCIIPAVEMFIDFIRVFSAQRLFMAADAAAAAFFISSAISSTCEVAALVLSACCLRASA